MFIMYVISVFNQIMFFFYFLVAVVVIELVLFIHLISEGTYGERAAKK